FQMRTMDVFERVKNNITHLICSGDLTRDPTFSKVLGQCPKLLSLDISHSTDFTEQLKSIPYRLEELDISKCAWLSEYEFRQIVQICPHLSSLKLSSNVQLNFSAWSELQKLKGLKVLDLSRCNQIQDRDLKIILMACRMVTDLELEECKGIT